ncbi:riboflavin synthase [Flavisolibacter tropicus]|nr:riboflavin synthase [Flavisolibacter tropicus]
MQKPEICPMFTGIIEVLGQVKEVEINGTNKTFWIQSPLSSEFKVDQSIAHNGVCLTVEEIRGDSHRVTAVQETLEKTALNQWREGFFVNIERSLLPSSRLDGHFVQGHVDTIGICEKIEDKKGSWEFTFSFSENFAPLVIEKGSISLNGTSLTVYNVGKNTFSVAIIPYTYEHTILQYLKESEQVNLEFDMVGKYIVRNLSLKN